MTIQTLLFCASAWLVASPALAQRKRLAAPLTSTHTVVTSAAAPAPIGPYSQAVQAGTTVYVSGQIALDAATGQLVGNGDVKAETQQVMKNLVAILAAAGLTPRDVVKCSIFVKDLGSFGLINETYGSYFDVHAAPARETVQVSALPKAAQVEISCIAVKQ